MLIADLLKDQAYKEALDKKGFIVLPLLNAEEVGRLHSLYMALRASAGVAKEFYTSIWSDNEEHRRAVDHGVKEILLPALQKHFRDIQPVFANFMIKASGKDSSLLPHQDWSFVDEPKYDSVTVWVPLMDVNNDNGNLQVVPGSHLALNNYVRPRFGDAPFDRSDASRQLIDIPLKVGEALILNSRLIHASPNNVSGKERIAASVVIAPEEAKLKHWLQKGNEIEEFEIDVSFFWRYSCYDHLENFHFS